jgi:hypothetical protein
MFLHALSQKVCRDWPIAVDSQKYQEIVRGRFNNKCPYCLCELAQTQSIVEHLDGMNRLRAGLHVPGNVLVACRKCNSEKRRDDASKTLSLADSGWASFLSHDGTRCRATCPTCLYWRAIWPEAAERDTLLRENIERIRSFRREFSELERVLPFFRSTLPGLLTKLYSECQSFAESEIKSLLEIVEGSRNPANAQPAEDGKAAGSNV